MHQERPQPLAEDNAVGAVQLDPPTRISTLSPGAVDQGTTLTVGVPGYPFWAGGCTGPSAGVWRVGNPEEWKNDLSRYPLYPPKKAAGASRWPFLSGMRQFLPRSST
jgi:hypothetical protein